MNINNNIPSNINLNNCNAPIPSFIPVRGFKLPNGPLILSRTSPHTYLVPTLFPMPNPIPASPAPITPEKITSTVSTMKATAAVYQPSQPISRTNQIFNQLKPSFDQHLKSDIKQMQSELNRLRAELAKQNIESVQPELTTTKTEEKSVTTAIKSEKYEVRESECEEYVEFQEEDEEDNFSVSSNQSEESEELIDEDDEIENSAEISNETKQEEARKLDFYEIPPITISKKPRTYFNFEGHQISFGKDFTTMYRQGKKEDIGFEHARTRLELFYKTCEFIENNRDFFTENKIPLDIEHNQFRASRNYTPKKEELSINWFQQAHISFFPNLACMRRNLEKMFLKGGDIDLNGQLVTLDQMLNLTNIVPPKVNEIDAICEADFRYDGLLLLRKVSLGLLSAKDATHELSQYYKVTMNIIWNQINHEKIGKNKGTLNSLKEKLDRAYPKIGVGFFLNLGPQDKPYVDGIRKAIFNYLDTYTKEKK